MNQNFQNMNQTKQETGFNMQMFPQFHPMHGGIPLNVNMMHNSMPLMWNQQQQQQNQSAQHQQQQFHQQQQQYQQQMQQQQQQQNKQVSQVNHQMPLGFQNQMLYPFYNPMQQQQYQQFYPQQNQQQQNQQLQQSQNPQQMNQQMLYQFPVQQNPQQFMSNQLMQPHNAPIQENAQPAPQTQQNANHMNTTTPTIQLSKQENLEQKLKKRQKIEEQIIIILDYLTANVGKKNTTELFEKKKDIKGLSDEELQVFDNLIQKYLNSNKTKEEKIKFILRKCFKHMKSQIEVKEITSQKDIDESFFEKYFNKDQMGSKMFLDESDLAQFSIGAGVTGSIIASQLAANGGGQEDEFAMPFKKNSKIKTMNSTFLKKVFKSRLFYEDYKEYLDHFDEIAEKENQKKIKKCAESLMNMVESKNIQKIKSYKRLPWTRKWLEETKALAHKLLSYATDDALVTLNSLPGSVADLDKTKMRSNHNIGASHIASQFSHVQQHHGEMPHKIIKISMDSTSITDKGEEKIGSLQDIDNFIRMTDAEKEEEKRKQEERDKREEMDRRARMQVLDDEKSSEVQTQQQQIQPTQSSISNNQIQDLDAIAENDQEDSTENKNGLQENNNTIQEEKQEKEQEQQQYNDEKQSEVHEKKDVEQSKNQENEEDKVNETIQTEQQQQSEQQTQNQNQNSEEEEENAIQKIDQQKQSELVVQTPQETNNNNNDQSQQTIELSQNKQVEQQEQQEQQNLNQKNEIQPIQNNSNNILIENGDNLTDKTEKLNEEQKQSSQNEDNIEKIQN